MLSTIYLNCLPLLSGLTIIFICEKKQGDKYSDSDRYRLIIAAAIGAFIGSRLLALLEHPSLLHFDATLLISMFTSKTIVGGLLGGLFAIEIAKKIYGYRFSSGDLLVYPLIVAMIIGRVGCHIHGLHDATVGIATTHPFALDYGDGILRHPTSLYEIAFLILLFIGLKLLTHYVRFQEGACFKIFLISYLFFRLLIEFIKPGVIVFIGLTPIQCACILGLAYYLPVMLHPLRLMTNKATGSENAN